MFSVKVRLRLKQSSYPSVNTFTFMHLADAFIQSDLQLHSGYTFLLVHVFPGLFESNIFFILLLEVLRSGDLNLLLFPQSRLNRRGDGAFSVVGPRLWINLLLEIRSAPSLSIFKSLLKTHVFDLAF